jgi:hypothetical protein
MKKKSLLDGALDIVALVLLPIAVVSYTLGYWWRWIVTGEKPKY